MKITKIQTLNYIQERLELTASNRSRFYPNFVETETLFSYLKQLETGPCPAQQQASTHLVFYFSKISVYVIFTLGHTRPTSFEVSQPEFGSYLYVFLVFSIYPLLHIALLVFSLFNYGLCAISSMINSTKRSSYCYVINWSRNPKQFTQPEGFPSLQTAAHFLYQH